MTSKNLKKSFDEINEYIAAARRQSLLAYEVAIKEGLTPEEAKAMIPYLSNSKIRTMIDEVCKEQE